MKQNAGTVDRLARMLVGIVLLLMVFFGPQTPLGWIGLVPLLTGALGFCPLYTVLGFSTCPMKKD